MPIVDPFETTLIKREKDIIDPFQPLESFTKTWEEIKTSISSQATPEEQTRTRNAMAISATHDLPFDAAYDAEPSFVKRENKPNLFEYTGRSFVAGVGDMYINLGNIFKMTKVPTGGIADTWIDYGKKMQNMYIPADDKPLT